MSDAVAPLDLLALDGLLTQDEKDVRTSVRAMVDEHVRPYVAQWFEEGTLPARDLALEFGRLGVLGMHLEGDGCAGMNATSYGVAAGVFEAAGPRGRSVGSGQG